MGSGDARGETAPCFFSVGESRLRARSKSSRRPADKWFDSRSCITFCGCNERLRNRRRPTAASAGEIARPGQGNGNIRALTKWIRFWTAKTPRSPRKAIFQRQKTWRSWRLGG